MKRGKGGGRDAGMDEGWRQRGGGDAAAGGAGRCRRAAFPAHGGAVQQRLRRLTGSARCRPVLGPVLPGPVRRCPARQDASSSAEVRNKSVRIPAAVTGQPCSQEPAAWRLPKTGRGVRATRTLRQLSRGGSMAPRVLSPNLALWCKRVSSGTWRWVPSPRRRPCGTLSSTSTTSRRRISASSCASTSWKSASNRRARKAGTMSTGGTLS
ncbi:uncharacterized protein ACIB01_011174 isoform 1-T2 [Guaruba guarouba]